MKDIITPQQRANLEKLAAYLESGDLKARFEMEHYSDSDDYTGATHCGTGGCAVGHGPYAGIEKLGYETWRDYSYRVFLTCNTAEQELTWSFLFSGCWSETSFDQAIHAAKRIRHFLKGLPINLKSEYSILKYSQTPECENIHK